MLGSVSVPVSVLERRERACLRCTPVPHVSSLSNSDGSATDCTLSTQVEWTELLSNLSDLTTFHGIRFFYEVSTADPVATVGVSDRSRIRKNDEIASVLAWKCPKLRRLDHWEEGSGKVIVLLRDGEKVKYEVRRVKL